MCIASQQLVTSSSDDLSVKGLEQVANVDSLVLVLCHVGLRNINSFQIQTDIQTDRLGLSIGSGFLWWTWTGVTTQLSFCPIFLAVDSHNGHYWDHQWDAGASHLVLPGGLVQSGQGKGVMSSVLLLGSTWIRSVCESKQFFGVCG